ncbi:MAG: hypothetical protein KTR26_14305 [Flammeovirgaceae bacterium]|nr:hypothetical protein [Flammeovirgaceae bacterium]
MLNKKTILKVWGQDPSVENLGKVDVNIMLPEGKIPMEIYCDGERLKDLFLAPHAILLVPFNSEKQEDIIHTYSVSLMLLQYCEKLLGKPIVWSWNREGANLPLVLYPYYDEDINAYYVKEDRAVQLCKYGLPPNKKYACRSFDIVAHETAHVIYDALQPGWHDLKTDLEAGAIKEAFCDLCAVFLFLSQPILCDYILSVTGNDLMKKSVLSTIGEEFYKSRLRDINVLVNYNKVNKARKYEFAIVFSGGTFEVLSNYFRHSLKESKIENQSALLMETSRDIAQLLLTTIANGKEAKPTMALLITKMIGFAKENAKPVLAEIISESFRKRGVI